MAHQATLHYSEALVRQAVRAAWLRLTGVGFLAAMLVIAAAVVALLFQGNTSWLTGTLATVFAIGVVAAVALYTIPARDSLRKFREMESPVATFVADESTFTFSSEQGTTTVKWSVVTDVWRFKEFWLLSLSKSQFITLPLADMPTEMQAYVLERTQAAGGKERGTGVHGQRPPAGPRMTFAPLLRYSLLLPVLALLLPYVYSLLVMWGDSGSSLKQRGGDVVLAVSAIATCVELIAVPVAIYHLLMKAQYRTIGNFVLLLVGMLPVAFLALTIFIILYGHG